MRLAIIYLILCLCAPCLVKAAHTGDINPGQIEDHMNRVVQNEINEKAEEPEEADEVAKESEEEVRLGDLQNTVVNQREQLQTPMQKEKIYLKGTDGEPVGFPLYTEKISGLIREKRKENGDVGTKEHPIAIGTTRETLHKVRTLLKKLKHLGRNNHAHVVGPENFSKNTIFVSHWVNREIHPLISAHSIGLEQLYLAVLELDIDPLVNTIAAKIVMQLRDLAINRVTAQDALKCSGFHHTPDHGYISLHYKHCQNGEEYHSVEDHLGEYGHLDVDGYGHSGLVQKIDESVTLHLGQNFTSFKGIKLIDNNQINFIFISGYGYSNQLQNKGLDVHFPAEPFVNFKNLKWLTMDCIQWDILPETFFNGVDKLETLQIERSNITTLPRKVLRNLRSLRTFKLSEAPITSLPADLLTDLDQLKTVLINHCSLLTIVPADFFQKKTTIREIKIRNCDMIRLPPNLFDGLINLEELDLTAPNTMTFPRGMKNLTNLRKVWVTESLTWNQVYQLRKKVRRGVKLYWGDSYYRGNRCYLFNMLPVLS